ncbi:hypothetical protein ASD15_11095 [Massilia sp. Root351]|jgi:hypothetical protein|uniref:hypothetical protein n=1 Tax=Massilia sp. Root351 TaxID=1736522 RepID=UPI00070F154D|nr:hypothetical protein [Massilia sp. Root351]KQV82537.1 hypothetical protein ASD15_11095 [Massilia sp. Root351]
MGAAFWIKRYLLAAVPLFAILAGVEYVKGTPTQADILSAGVWAAVAAAIFVGTQYRRYRKNQECAPCDAVGKPTKANKPNTRS